MKKSNSGRNAKRDTCIAVPLRNGTSLYMYIMT